MNRNEFALKISRKTRQGQKHITYFPETVCELKLVGKPHNNGFLTLEWNLGYRKRSLFLDHIFKEDLVLSFGQLF
jgi:hypothetical protein